MSEEVKLQRSTRHRFPSGKDWNGNSKGRPRNPESEELRKALKIAQKSRNKSFLLHFVERAYINDNVAIALAKKLLPDKIEGEGFATKQYIIIRNAENTRAHQAAG